MWNGDVVTPVKKRPCTISGIDYESESAAARALGLSVPTLLYRLRSSNFPGYISKYHSKIQHKRGSQIRCSIMGVEYDSISEASAKLGMRFGVIARRLQSFDYPDYVCVDKPKELKPATAPRYAANGRKYSTLREIAEMEGLTQERIRQKMNSSLYPEYRRL